MTRLRPVALMPLVTLLWLGCSPKGPIATPGKKRCDELPLAVHLKVGKLINLNVVGQAQPVQVRLLLLKERETFDALDFQTVWQEGEKELEGILVRTIEFTVFPGQDKVSTYQAPRSVAYAAFIGLFRKPHESEWRQVIDLRAGAKGCVEGGLHIPVNAEVRDNRLVRYEAE